MCVPGGGASQESLLMRVPFIGLTAVVCGALLLAIPQPTMSVEPQETAAQIDFDALRAQATAALDALQQSQERRLASAESATF